MIPNPKEQNAPDLCGHCLVRAKCARKFPVGVRALGNFWYVILLHATVSRTKPQNRPGSLETTGRLRYYIEIDPCGAVGLGGMGAVKARSYQHSSASILAGDVERLLRMTCRGDHGA